MNIQNVTTFGGDLLIDKTGGNIPKVENDDNLDALSKGPSKAPSGNSGSFNYVTLAGEDEDGEYIGEPFTVSETKNKLINGSVRANKTWLAQGWDDEAKKMKENGYSKEIMSKYFMLSYGTDDNGKGIRDLVSKYENFHDENLGAGVDENGRAYTAKHIFTYTDDKGKNVTEIAYVYADGTTEIQEV